MTRAQREARKAALRRYIVFRVKIIEFLDLLALFSCLRANKMKTLLAFLQFRPPQFVADSLRTVLVSWFALLIDKNGTDAIKLWCEVFPKHATQTKAAWEKMEPTWSILRGFRDRAGFHADAPFKYFGARHELREAWPIVNAALQEFEKLLKFFLKIEAAEIGKELEVELDAMLDELEVRHGKGKYKRPQFKSYLMITAGG